MTSPQASPVQIRPVTAEDYAAWHPLWTGYNAFYGRHGETALPEEITRATWARFLDDAEPMVALLALLDGRVVGLAHYLFHRSTLAIGPSCYLHDLYTDETVRGRGVAGALIEAVADRAREAGAGRCYWQTHETNAVARRLYDRVGERSGFIVYRKAL